MTVPERHAENSSEITIRELLQDAQQRLTKSSESSGLDAEVLLAHALFNSRTYLHTWPDEVPSQLQVDQFNQLLERRIKGEPVAYLTGVREFWSLQLAVTPDTLIPRPETELLVELALDRIPNEQPYRVIDLGTGAGAIAIAIAHERPHCDVFATDISSSAIHIAHHNAIQHGLDNITFLEGDWFAPVGDQRFDIIIANPPYVRKGDPYLQQGDLRFEPAMALVAGGDGIEAITQITTQSRAHLHLGGWLMVEHGYNQQHSVIDLFRQSGYKNIKGFSDNAGQDRAVIGQYFK